MSGAVDWRKLGVRPGSEDLVRFGICFSIFVLCAVLNLFSIPEQPLRRSSSFENEVEDTNKDTTVRVLAVSYEEPLDRPCSSGNKGKYGSFGNGVEDTNKDTLVRVLTISYEPPLERLSASENKVLTVSTKDRPSDQQNGLEQGFGNRTNHSTQATLCQSEDKDTAGYVPSALEKSVSISIPTFCTSIVRMPGSLARLCLTQLLAWLGFMAIMLFFTDFMGRRVYGGHPQAAAGSEARRRYEEGVEMGCWGLTINAAACTVISGVADFSLRRLGLRTIYMCETLLFGVSMAGMVALVELTSEGWPFLLLCPAMGLMYSTLSIVPYRLLSQYHRNEQYITSGPDSSGRRGMGVDCALLTAQIQLSRVIIGAVMGPVVNAAGTLTVTVIMAAGLAFCAFLATAFLVQYET
ncbi:membrane-associated transporter protein-like [Branchiostoma floridae]|uniref:Membrane-associated transporter protein-like n=1 Tax=Branchiostoma floridae TaxID=7739 RepID=A0A9J7M6J7_BRAFL|nr:membrane-associated transporter protein-like [Branchiostoma floridae]